MSRRKQHSPSGLPNDPLLTVEAPGEICRNLFESAMSTVSYVIQVNHDTVGIAVRHDADYRFYASIPEYSSLEGLSFRRLRDVEQAASRVGAGHEHQLS